MKEIDTQSKTSSKYFVNQSTEKYSINSCLISESVKDKNSVASDSKLSTEGYLPTFTNSS